MLRKLVSIQIINNIRNIKGRDRVDVASVLGWDVVVKRNEFKNGQKIIFAECDSVFPDGPEYCEFLRSRKFRIRTMKVNCDEGPIISQGLALPCSILPGSEELEVGTEVTEQLNVKKYEPHLHDGGAALGRAAGNYPHFVPKTDELRLQSKIELLQELYDAGAFYISIKVDGTSSTFCYDEDEFCACSRNWKKKPDDENIYWEMARKYNLESVLKDNKHLAVQGEIAGSKVQHNRLRLNGVDLFVFDIYDITKRRYFGLNDMLDFCEAYKLRTVPIESIVIKEDVQPLSIWLKRAEGLYENTDQQREGVVVRPINPVYSPTISGRLSFKVINNLYLLSGGD